MDDAFELTNETISLIKFKTPFVSVVFKLALVRINDRLIVFLAAGFTYLTLIISGYILSYESLISKYNFAKTN